MYRKARARVCVLYRGCERLAPLERMRLNERTRLDELMNSIERTNVIGHESTPILPLGARRYSRRQDQTRAFRVRRRQRSLHDRRRVFRGARLFTAKVKPSLVFFNRSPPMNSTHFSRLILKLSANVGRLFTHTPTTPFF